MKRKKLIGKTGMLAGICLIAGSMAGCVKMPEIPVVRAKGMDAAENYREESGETQGYVIGAGGMSDGLADGGGAEMDLYTLLAAPRTYRSEVSDAAGKLKVITDATVEIPTAGKVSAIHVGLHPFGQAEMELITKAFFGDADVYDARPYMEKTEEEWQTASRQREMIKVEPPFPFMEELIDPFFEQLGSVSSFYGIVPMEDGDDYRYEMVKSATRPMQVFIKKIDASDDLEDSRSSQWFDYVSMKTLYPWLPDEESLVSDIGISMEEAKKIADGKVMKLNLEGMEMAVSEYAVEIGGHHGAPGPDDLKKVGYCFHYTRKLNGIPITYTTATGGFKDNADSGINPWCYETLDIYVTKDGIDEVTFLNQYTAFDTKADDLDLMPFSEIMSIYEKMMIIQKAEILTDERAFGGDVGAPPEALTYRVDRIVFGYGRIYDPQAGDAAGLLVPVWDFFGEYESDFGEGGNTGGSVVREENNSFLTINAIDGTVINRQRGY